jgi:DNA-binding FadR family transcriptional regulator
MTRYRLPREIVREALHLLAEEGVIEGRRGLGTRSGGDHPTMSAFLPPLT